MTKEEVIKIWEKQCQTKRIVRSKTTFDPTIWQMLVRDAEESVSEITIMKGDKFYWISVNYVLKLEHNKMYYKVRTIEYVPCNKTFELTEQEYNHLVSLFSN